MPKPKSKSTPTTPTDTATGDVLSLAALNDLQIDARVDLYVATENRQRLGFLLQGKILHTLGDDGTAALTAAGIKRSSLHNARKAEWVIATLTGKAFQELVIHNGVEAVPFSEALFDTFTLRQCELLQVAFTSMGTHKHRPSRAQAMQLCAMPEWDDEIETFLEHGVTRTGLADRQAQAQAALRAEAERQEQMRQQIAASTAENERLRAQLAANPPAAPQVQFNVQPPVTPTAVQDDEPENIVEFTHEPEGEEAEETDADIEIEDGEEAADAAVEIHDDITPEDIGEAVAAATTALNEYAQEAPAHLSGILSDFEDDCAEMLEHCDVGTLHDLESRLSTLLDLVRGHLAAKAAAQDDLPTAKPKAKKGKKAKLTA